MEPLTAGLLSGGASILSGIFGKPKGGESTHKKTMEAARGAIDAQNKYGINALELIRSGAGAGGGGSSPRVGSVAAMTQGFDQIANVLSGREAQEREAANVQLELDKIELDNKKAEASTRGKTNITGTVGRANVAAAVGTPESQVPEFELVAPTITSANVSHSGAWIDPHTPDAETVEARYGDVLQEIGGVRNIFNDTIFNSRMVKILEAHGAQAGQKIYDAYVADPSESLPEVYKKLYPDGKALDWAISNPQEYEKPVMRKKPTVGWADEKFGKFN